MQHGVSRSATRGHAGDGVVECLAGANIARAQIIAHGVHDDASAAARDIFLALIHLRHRGGAHGRKPDQFHDGGHGVRRKLAAASARAGAGMVFDVEEFGVGHAAPGIRAHRFENILNADVVPIVLARQDRPAI